MRRSYIGRQRLLGCRCKQHANRKTNDQAHWNRIVIMPDMQQVNVGIVGLGNVGMGALAILAENAEQIALKLGFHLNVTAVCSRNVQSKTLSSALGPVLKTNDWREVVHHPDVDIVAEL